MVKFKKGIAVLMLSMAAIPTFAQNGSNDFSPYWYAGLQGGVGLTVGEASIGKLLTPSAAISGGYQFSSLLGARASISGWQGKGSALFIIDTYKFNYIQGSVDLTLDVASLFHGYDRNRLVTPYLFGGIGVVNAFNNDDAVACSEAGHLMGNLWSGNITLLAARAGIGANFKISDRVALNLELNGNALPDKYNSKSAPTLDWQCNAMAGVTVRFGAKKTAAEPTKSTPVKAAPTPAKTTPATPVAPAKTAPAEPAETTPTAPAKVVTPAPAPVESAKVAPRSVYFEINSVALSAAQSKMIDEVAAFMKSNPDKKLIVTGYADAATGTASYNMAISKRRAEGVSKLLVSKGVSADRITVDYKGDTVQPYGVVAENRAVICEFK